MIKKRQRDRQSASCRGRRGERLSNEVMGILIALAAVGAALAGLIFAGNRELLQEVSQLRTELRQDIKQGEARLEGQINGVREEVNQSDRVCQAM